jgi:hypothetical protein
VLDALLYHQSEVAPHRHHTDGGGDSDQRRHGGTARNSHDIGV